MNAQIIEKNGKPEWAIIPYGEFIKIQELLENAEDIKVNLKAIANSLDIEPEMLI